MVSAGLMLGTALAFAPLLHGAGSRAVPQEKASQGVGVDEHIGTAIAAVAGPDLSRLHSYGIGVEDGKFIRLDPQTFEPLQPVDYATWRELDVIYDKLRMLQDQLADALAKQLGDRSYARELELQPEIMARLSARKMDGAALQHLRRALDNTRKGGGEKNPWGWLFDVSDSQEPLTGATAPTPGARRHIFQPPLADQYLAAANDDSKRLTGARLLGYTGFSGVPKLSQVAADDPSPAVREEAVEQLGHLGGPAVFDTLKRLYEKETDAEVKARILYAFSRGRDPRAVDLALEVYRKNDPLQFRQQDAALNILGGNFTTSRQASNKFSPSLALFDLRRKDSGDRLLSFSPRAAEIFSVVGAAHKENSLKHNSVAYTRRIFLDMIQQSYLMKSADKKAQQEFFAAVQDPAAIYAAFATMKLPDSSIGDGLFSSLQAVLAKNGQTLIDWAKEQDPRGTYAKALFFQLSEMGLLIPAIRRDPSLAKDIGKMVLAPGDGTDPSRVGIFMDSVVKNWPPATRLELLKGIVEARAPENSPHGRDDALLSALSTYYGAQWTPEEKRLIRQVVPDARFEQSVPVLTAGRNLKGVVAFDSYQQYSDFLLVARAHGYQVASTGKNPRLSKGPIEFELFVEPAEIKNDYAIMLARLNRSAARDSAVLDAGMREKKRSEWEDMLARKMSDAHFLVLRGEPWFMTQATRLLAHSPQSKPKLVFLGACYSVGNASWVKSSCPDCTVIANSGTGRYLINNEVLFTTLDALAQGAKDWRQVGAKLAGVLPQRHHEVVGPWHFASFYQDQLKASRPAATTTRTYSERTDLESFISHELLLDNR
ncbi:MAG: HEAT repeat domain-containing protein [Elusimicrobiota bacterium]